MEALSKFNRTFSDCRHILLQTFSDPPPILLQSSKPPPILLQSSSNPSPVLQSSSSPPSMLENLSNIESIEHISNRYRTAIANLSNTNRKSIEHLSKSIENLWHIYRCILLQTFSNPPPTLLQSSSNPAPVLQSSSNPLPMLLQSPTNPRRSTEMPSKFYRTSIENTALPASRDICSIMCYSFQILLNMGRGRRSAWPPLG